MMSILNPYLSFRDNAREAMEFYRSVFGGELTVTTLGEANASEDPADRDKIMHGQLTTPNGFTLMGADTPSSMEHTPGNTMSVSLSGDEEDELTSYWNALAVDAQFTMGLDKAPWGDTFGMLTDKFGVQWMVNIAGSPSES
ncbi:VOC family protein [Rhodococcus sp. 06-418-5]|uniref:VOC family protein n=1 Tax=Nocardiaceae TaxID=85025 RepID=UPI00050C79F8|nr:MULTISPECIES: VOC family protein [Rhodococcus]OZC58505.1 VOC family protein [Rhodococcus sp. 06-470-2]OZC83141.1 VOC family protein [Rhodococcus sp. 06-418-5]OZD77425.1 VOC family protein [Rhodococcus sp. 05-339-2]OZE05713.1 VOC family protein [Rhodococcus sp. 05-2255-3B1]OZE08919.1 VOC family protein [Rhodococcus sp. 05-2255-3C]